MRPINPSYSPELETLDQLLGGDLKLSVIRRVFQSDQRFVEGLGGLLRDGDVTLFADGVAVPEWKVRELFRDGAVLTSLPEYVLHLTEKGAQKVA
jgi:hypothetical protein